MMLNLRFLIHVMKYDDMWYTIRCIEPYHGPTKTWNYDVDEHGNKVERGKVIWGPLTKRGVVRWLSKRTKRGCEIYLEGKPKFKEDLHVLYQD